jgi:hypothetical protein
MVGIAHLDGRQFDHLAITTVTAGRGSRGLGGPALALFRHIHVNMAAVADQLIHFLLVADVEPLDGKRRLMPRPIKIRNEHADFEFLYGDLSPLYTHGFVLDARNDFFVLLLLFCIVSKLK